VGSKREVLVLNSTPLIYLSKVGLIGSLAEIFEIVITRSVYREVVIEGRKVGAPEVESIERLISKGKIVIRDDPKEAMLLAETFRIGRGEASVLSLVAKENAVAIIDDEKARRVGKALGVRVHGTLFLLKLLLLLGIVSVDKLKRHLYLMVREGFHLSAEVLIEFVMDIKKEGSA